MLVAFLALEVLEVGALAAEPSADSTRRMPTLTSAFSVASTVTVRVAAASTEVSKVW